MIARLRSQRLVISAALAAVLIVLLGLHNHQPARAISAVIGRFYATCGAFAVDLAVNGTNNDLNGFDRFRYQIFDGNNKKLYSEDSTRVISNTVGSVVTNVSYDADGIGDGPPSLNPIRFQIQELDSAGNAVGVVAELKYDAKCLPASGQATFSGDFSPPGRFKARVAVTTPLYSNPAGTQIGLTVEAGKEFIVVYRSPDGQWASIFVGGSELPWVPINTLQFGFDQNQIPFQPTRIDNNAVTPIGTPIPIGTFIPGVVPTIAPVATLINIPSTNLSALVNTRLRLRAAPSTTSATLATIPSRTFVPLYGKDITFKFVKVAYNNIVGWVSVRYVKLNGATLDSLPIVQ